MVLRRECRRTYKRILHMNQMKFRALSFAVAIGLAGMTMVG